MKKSIKVEQQKNRKIESSNVEIKKSKKSKKTKMVKKVKRQKS